MKSQEKTQASPRRSRGARTALIVAASFAGLLAVGLLSLGGIALWGEGQKDERGYLSTDGHTFAAKTHALTTESIDLDFDGVEGLLDSTSLGDLRLDVKSRSGKPVFVGIARTEELASYLKGVSRTEMTDVDLDPFTASYSDEGGSKEPSRPDGERFWAASAQGAGSQTLSWDAEDGDWSVVVMNADGSPGVQADVGAAAKVPYLTEIGWSALGGGGLLLLATAGLVVLAVRPPRDGGHVAKPTEVAPVAS